MAILIIISIFFLILLLRGDEDNDGDDEVKKIYEESFPNQKNTKMFSHPTTGYTCDTQEQMNTYIINRERKLKENGNNFR